MNKCKINLWGRDFELKIEYDCYSDENVILNQEEAVNEFIKADEAVQNSKQMLENYVLDNNGMEIGADHIDNIFKYVIPKYLYIKREAEKRVVAIMCNYKFDMENGIAIVFDNERAIKVGKQDIIL